MIRYQIIRPLKASEYYQRVYWRGCYGQVNFFDFTGSRSETENIDYETYQKNYYDFYDTDVFQLKKVYSKKTVNPDTMTNEEMEQYIAEHKVACPHCGKCDWTNIRNFNLMFSTSRGVTEEGQNLIYLRPETAQGEFVNFLNVQRSMRAKVPFGIAQIGKAFRNEVTPGNFTFRTIEFEQMEHQWFCKADDSMDFYHEYKKKAWDFLVSLGFKEENLRYHDHDKLAFYAKAACDIQYNYPIGWEELNGIHHRSDHDLSRHQEFSGKSMLYLDPYTNEKYIPNVVEYSIGADRLTLAVLCEAYDEETLAGRYKSAMTALDVALGRGGNQAVIKNKKR